VPKNYGPRGRKRYLGPNPGPRPWPVAGRARGHQPGGSHDPNGCAAVVLLFLAVAFSGPPALLAAYLLY